MSHRKFEHPRHGSLGFLPRKRASRHRGKGDLPSCLLHCSLEYANDLTVACEKGFSEMV